MSAIAKIETVMMTGDLSKLTAEERVTYIERVCESLNLNPLTRPFEYLTLQGKTILYARRDAAEQLRKRDKVSTRIVSRETVEGCYVVTVEAETPEGRKDTSLGAVWIDGLRGEPLANALMKCETKAKRRVTLSICGLGMLDETEVDSFAPKVTNGWQGSAPSRPALAEGEVEPDADVVEAFVKDMEGCSNKAELADVGSAIKLSKSLTESGRKFLRTEYAKLAKTLPAAREAGDEPEVPQ